MSDKPNGIAGCEVIGSVRTVPGYIADALHELCTTTRKLERDRIADWMDGSAAQFAKDDHYATTARILANHAQSIREAEHHV